MATTSSVQQEKTRALLDYFLGEGPEIKRQCSAYDCFFRFRGSVRIPEEKDSKGERDMWLRRIKIKDDDKDFRVCFLHFGNIVAAFDTEMRMDRNTRIMQPKLRRHDETCLPDSYEAYKERKDIFEKRGKEGLYEYYCNALESSRSLIRKRNAVASLTNDAMFNTPKTPKHLSQVGIHDNNTPPDPIDPKVLQEQVVQLQQQLQQMSMSYFGQLTEIQSLQARIDAQARPLLRVSNVNDQDLLALTGHERNVCVELASEVDKIERIRAVVNRRGGLSKVLANQTQEAKMAILKDAEAYNPSGPVSKWTTVDKVFLALTWIRTGMDFTQVSILFGGLQMRYAAKLIFQTVTALRHALMLKFPFMSRKPKPGPNIDFGNMLHHFNIQFIIDCFELPVQKPGDVDEQRAYWSSYKHAHTIKFLLCINAQGWVCYISPGYPGAISDDEIVKVSGFLDYVRDYVHESGRSVGVLADKGFKCFEDFKKSFSTLVTPALLEKGRHTGAESLVTRRIASVRIFVECAVRGVKISKVLKYPKNGKSRFFMEACTHVAAFLTRYGKPFCPNNQPERKVGKDAPDEIVEFDAIPMELLQEIIALEEAVLNE